MTDPTTPDSGPVLDHGTRVRLRRLRLKATQGELAEAAGVNRDTVGAIEQGGGSASKRRDVDEALDREEAQAGLAPWADDMADKYAPRPSRPEQPEPRFIRIKVEGVYGAKALIVEGSPDDQAQLEAMVDRIMRNLRDEPGSGVE